MAERVIKQSTHTTALLDAGVDLKIVANRLGHDNTQTTSNIYDHVTNKRKQKLSDVIDSLSN